MNTEIVNRHFERMGAAVRIEPFVPDRWRTAATYAVDVRKGRRGEFFRLQIAGGHEVEVVDVRPRERHLLLMVRTPSGMKDKFLCGHDERAWFAAAVPDGASTVRTAMEALKPWDVTASYAATRVRTRDRNRRRNAAFIRQGEWFFLPCPATFRPKANLVLPNEPIRRGRSKPHMCEFLYREKGVPVRVCRERPNGITEEEYRALVLTNPMARRAQWTRMVRDAHAYARGRVRHPDHKTIVLDGWHRIHPNRETETRAMPNLAFLD